MEPKKIEKLLIILSILMVIIVLLIIHFVKNGTNLPNIGELNKNRIDSDSSSDNTVENIYIDDKDYWKADKISEDEIILEEANDLYTYYLMKQCLENYYNTETVEKALNIIDEEAKKALNLTRR